MSYPSIRPWAGGLSVLALLFATQYALPVAATSQEPTSPPPEALLQGVVVYADTGQPVESATVSVIGTNLQMETGQYGDFAFVGVPPGLTAIRVTAEGHPSVTEEVDFRGDRILFLQFQLPSIAAVLDELLVGVDRAENVADSRTAADLLIQQAPSLGRPTSGNVGNVDDGVGLQLRSAPNSMAGAMEPHVYIDGVRITGSETALEMLRMIPASNVRDIEILRGPVAAFLYPLAASGVVLVTTISGSPPR